MTHKYLSKTPVMILIAMFCCFLWGSAFSCIKIGYKMFGISGNDTASQILFAGIRFTIAGIMVIAVESFRKREFVPPKHPGYIAILAAFQTVIQYLFFYIGLANTTGVKASIITGAGTFFTILICCLGFKQEKLTTKKIVGSLIGFVGLIVVNLTGSGFDFNFRLLGEGFIFVAAFSGAMAQGYIKKFSSKANVVMLSGYQFFFGGVVMTIAGALFGGRLNMAEGMRSFTSGPTPGGVFDGDIWLVTRGGLLLLYMGFISAAAYTLWGILLKYNDVSKVAACKFMNPVFGAILSFAILQEANVMGWQVAVALVLVSIGIFVVNYEKNKK
ncbi:MAG: DMT family transporter [Eubacterium sp.]|nr:DMT family transporter [Eubacterium sp.]